MSSRVLALSQMVLEKYILCSSCLGRCFARLGYSLTNAQRGEAIKSLLFLESTIFVVGNNEDNSLDSEDVLYTNIDSLRKSGYLPAEMWAQRKRRLSEKRNLLNSTDDRFFDDEQLEIHQSGTKCVLCSSIFTKLDSLCQKIIETIASIESKNFLIIIHLPPEIVEKEKEIQSMIPSNYVEPLKTELARELGKRVSAQRNFEPEFHLPQLSINISPYKEDPEVDLYIRSIYIYGVYNKFSREISQTRWPCGSCQPYLKRRFRRRARNPLHKRNKSAGDARKKRGCESCNFTGFRFATSVEQEIEKGILKIAGAKTVILHGGGREDVDVQMLGTGRPCIIEIVSPHFRPPTYSLEELESMIDQSSLIKVKLFKFTVKNSVKIVKKHSESSRKSYLVTISCGEDTPHASIYSLEQDFSAKKILQRTPTRVAHRRSDLVREKQVYQFKIKEINQDSFQAEIVCSGGTYVKELVSGDDGRTQPSLSSVLGGQYKCLQLDVLTVERPELSKILENSSP